ncbi:MAG: outer membrane beta-barrel protein [Planctomycetota bacterium]
MSISTYAQSGNRPNYVIPTAAQSAPVVQTTPTPVQEAAPVAAAPVVTSESAGSVIYQDVTTGSGSMGCTDGCATMECGSGCDPQPWKLFGRNCDDPWVNIGGWLQGGVHTDGNGLFNNQPSDFNVHQAWLFAERVAESKNGRMGFGFRFDGVYGIDAQDTQAFGNPGATWDRAPGFQRNGGFGWALPQLYGEVAMGDMSVKVGHFFTLVGYETVTAPDNFFYSHAMTMYNSEPFTHTGAIATWAMNDATTVYGGWTAGWDSGFDFSAGSNFLGGFSTQLDPDVTLTYITTIGNFGLRSNYRNPT